MTGFLLVRGMVFEEVGDPEVDGVAAPRLIGHLQGPEVCVETGPGTGEQGDRTAPERGEPLDREVTGIDIRQPQDLGTEDGEDDGTADGLHETDSLCPVAPAEEVLPEETVLGPEIPGHLGIAVPEHRADPLCPGGDAAYQTVGAPAALVDHPVDGLATAAPAQPVALGTLMHLCLAEAIDGTHLMTEVTVVGACLVDPAPVVVRRTAEAYRQVEPILPAQGLEGIGEAVIDRHRSSCYVFVVLVGRGLGEGRFNRPLILPSLSMREVRMGA